MYCIAVQRVIKDVLDLSFFFFSLWVQHCFKKKITVVLALACFNLSFGGGLYSIVIYIISIVASPALIKDCSSVQGFVL